MENSKNKDNYYLKVKEYTKKNAYTLRREFDYSILNDYDKMSEKINNAIMDIKKIKKLDGKFPIYILNHPEIQTIFIYNKKLWDFYFKSNLINECINNKILKIEYVLYNEKEVENIDRGQKILKNKKEIMKYIIKNISFDIYFNTFVKFLKQKKDIAKEYGQFLITEIISDNIKEKKDDDDFNIEENININSLINESIYNENENEKQLNEKFYKDFFLHGRDYCNIIDNKYKEFKDFSNNKKSLEEIKKLFDEEELKDKDLDSVQLNLDESKSSPNTNLNLQNSDSLNGISLLNDNNDITNSNEIFSVLNPPDDYVKKLMNNDKLFKKINKNEYYSGIEEFKDIINRESILNLSKNSFN
jgi:hypothetical protein